MESEATPTVEANFRPPETRGNFSVETPADSGVMDINSQEYAEYKSGVEAADQARLAEVRERIEWFKYHYGFNSETEPFNNFEVVNVDGKNYFVDYVSKDVLGSGINGMAYGVGTGRYAQVREDLPPEIRNFVKAHELYHLQDTKSKSGLGAEVRASFYPMLKDRKGAWATIVDTFKRKERRDFYINRIKNWLLHNARKG